MWRSTTRRLLHPAREFTLDFLFPPRCGGCGRVGYGFCPECAELVTPVAEVGGWAAYAVDEGTGVAVDWRLEEAAIERFYAVGEYRGPLRKGLVKLKYGNGRYLAPALAAGLAGRLVEGEFGEAVLAPVPLHAKRHRERGYNQSVLLARELGRELGVAVLQRGLRRVKQTRPQVGLTAAKRRANVRGAFVADAEALGGRDVVIVDDVATTGATVMECAWACRKAGARRLRIAVVARG